jgi:hypothetical protein
LEKNIIYIYKYHIYIYIYIKYTIYICDILCDIYIYMLIHVDMLRLANRNLNDQSDWASRTLRTVKA